MQPAVRLETAWVLELRIRGADWHASVPQEPGPSLWPWSGFGSESSVCVGVGDGVRSPDWVCVNVQNLIFALDTVQGPGRGPRQCPGVSGAGSPSEPRVQCARSWSDLRFARAPGSAWVLEAGYLSVPRVDVQVGVQVQASRVRARAAKAARAPISRGPGGGRPH